MLTMANKEKKAAKKQKKAEKKQLKLDTKAAQKQYKLDKKQRKKDIKTAKKNGTYKKSDFLPPDDRIKIGLIGCGGIAHFAHIPAYLINKERVNVVAVCDIIPERAEKVKKKFFPDADVYTDYKELLADESIEAVDICTPNYLHSIIAVDAFAAGKNVFCEKPDAINHVEAAKMYAAAAEADKLLMVMRNNRFNKNSTYLKEYIDAGKMGEIYSARCGWLRRRGIPGKGGWFTTKEQSGGGPLIDLGVHMVDLTLWLMGNPKPVSVTGMTYKCFADSKASDSKNSKFGDSVENGVFDVEDMVVGMVRFDNGAVLQLEISWASNVDKEKRFVELRGTKAGAYWSGSHVEMYEETKRGKLKTRNVSEAMLVPEHTANLNNFIDVLLGKEDSVYKIEEGYDMMKLIDAIYASADQDGKEVLL